MKCEVTNTARENVGGATPGKRLLVTCAAPEGDTDQSLRNLSFTVPYTPENCAKYQNGAQFDLTL